MPLSEKLIKLKIKVPLTVSPHIFLKPEIIIIINSIYIALFPL